MKKFAWFFIAVFFALPVLAAESETDNITDIPEKGTYQKGSYTASEETTTLNAKKDEGFDFKVPEILITGQVDTKIMLKREITSLEDLQSVKSILYENEKIYMPDYYLKEESLTPKALEMGANRDFVGQLRLSAGTYSGVLADGIIGRAFDRDNKAILRLTHNNSVNEKINDVDTYNNTNSMDLYYSTKYDFVDAVYRIGADMDWFGNPYPAQVYYKKFQAIDEAFASANYSFALSTYIIDAQLQYRYFGALDSSNDYAYKENRTSFKGTLEKDFELEGGSKVKTITSLDVSDSDQSILGTPYDNTLDFNLFTKGILYLEPWVVQLGIRIQDYSFTQNNFSADPYIKLNFDILPDLSAYAEFLPELKSPDYTLLIPGSFVVASGTLKPSTDNVYAKAGLDFTLFDVFCSMYYGYRSVKDNIYMDLVPGSNAYTLYNNNVDYSFAGAEVETLKTRNFTLSASYEYRNIISADTTAVTYMPDNTLSLKLSADIFEWNFKVKAGVLSSAWGTIQDGIHRVPASAVIDASVSRKVNDYLTVEGYINNILNNNYYLLYYYKEKLLNLGIGLVFNF
jgi:outer membrane cobalamin receptor